MAHAIRQRCSAVGPLKLAWPESTIPSDAWSIGKSASEKVQIRDRAGVCWYLRLLRQLPQQELRSDADSSADLNKLDYFQTPFSALVFRDKRLVTVQLDCQLLLRNPRLFSGCNKPPQ
jgi:hypothetical protein